MKANEETVTVWGIHCTGDEEAMFHKNSVMAIGWNDMGDLWTGLARGEGANDSAGFGKSKTVGGVDAGETTSALRRHRQEVGYDFILLKCRFHLGNQGLQQNKIAPQEVQKAENGLVRILI